MELFTSRLTDPIQYGIFKDGDVDVFYLLEFYAVTSNTCFPDLFSKDRCQLLFILESHDINGDAACICTEADLVKIFCFSISIFNAELAITDVGVGNGFIVTVLTIEEL